MCDAGLVASTPSLYFDETEYACKCPCNVAYVEPRLLDVMDRARRIVGRPIIITSGFRCPEHNKAVGGKPESAHLTGEAWDILAETSRDRFRLLQAFFSLGVQRIGIGQAFLHIDVSLKLPQQVIWLYPAGA